MTPKNTLVGLSFLTLCAAASGALAYGGGGGGGASCKEVQFSEASPASNATVPSLASLSVTASAVLDPDTLEVQINGEKIQPAVSRQRSGDYLLQIKPASPVQQAGKVRITLRAKSTEGCETFEPLYINVQP